MRLLVTGGAGFIGSNFIHYWLKRHSDDTIVNLDKLTYAGNLDNLKQIESDKRYTFVKGDICDMALVIKTMEYHKIDTVVHFAAQSHVDRSVMLRQLGTLEFDAQQLFNDSLDNDFVINNVWGTHVLLEAAVHVWKDNMDGKWFHHVSTDEVFGALALDDPGKFSEETVYDPRSPYSASKAAADHLVRSYKTTFGLPITISNTSNNYGPYQYPEKLLPVAILNIIKDKKVPIYGDGQYVRDWLYVDDHARAIEMILQKGTIGETYLIGGLTDDVNNLNLIKRVLNIMKKPDDMIEFVKDRPGHDRRYAVDWSKAKNELGYKPAFDVDSYLEKTIQWYLDNKEWWEKILAGDDYSEWINKQYVKR